MNEIEGARAALRTWAARQEQGPSDPDSMDDHELVDWWADEALHGAELARRLLAAMDQPQPQLRQLVPGEEDQELACPDCGGRLSVRVEEVDYRRGAYWARDGSIVIGKSDNVDTTDVRLFCIHGDGDFEVPDIADWS